MTVLTAKVQISDRGLWARIAKRVVQGKERYFLTTDKTDPSARFSSVKAAKRAISTLRGVVICRRHIA